ncbi:hypothetical protein [Bacillus pinisoli]|uniref:hypothetical protein n=1 Tax=Bacillus pinisoli TaxID=2901866 RepID=UPI001FF37800|nr:hypothetical protein [Bacillus pinisoli]
MGKLLCDESPLIVLPSLAKLIGLNEAIVLQQIHYWLEKSTNIYENKKWVYNSYPQWKKQFPFWSERTLIRIMKSLKDKGLIIVDNFNRMKIDKTNWYSIDYEKVSSLLTTCQANHDNKSIPIPETTTKKNKYASNVFLTDSEYEKLSSEHGDKDTVEMIQILNNYKESSGKDYESDYHAILLWVVDRVNEKKKSTKKYTKSENESFTRHIEARDREIAFNKWVEEGKNPDEFTY